jgi:hypothetical protein
LDSPLRVCLPRLLYLGAEVPALRLWLRCLNLNRIPVDIEQNILPSDFPQGFKFRLEFLTLLTLFV